MAISWLRTAARGGEVTDSSVGEIKAALENAGVGYKAVEPREAPEQQVAIEHSDVRQPASAQEQHPDHHEDAAERPIVRVEAAIGKHGLQPLTPEAIQEATEQLEPAVARQRLVRELDGRVQ